MRPLAEIGRNGGGSLRVENLPGHEDSRGKL